MNGSLNNNIFDKNATYSFTIINEGIRKEENKYIYPNVVLINFDAFNKFKTNKRILDFRIRDEEGHIETPIYRSIHLILENLVNKEYNKDIKKLAEFLSIKDIDTLRKTYEGDKNYMACIRRVESSRTDPDFVGYYDLEEAHKQDLSDSYETGYDNDIKKEILRLLKIYLNKGYIFKAFHLQLVYL